ncbi:MAG: ABC transporter permease [Gammaproteobacteria bacterium]|nr:MAG: ABC transporter permease [Gammaproteobacteria bacterium]
MSTEALAVPRPGVARRSAFTPITVALAWRNLWRSRRRTWLTAGGVGFSIFIMVFAWSMQVGTFSLMIDNATSLISGHLQIQHRSFADDPGLRNTVRDASSLLAELELHPEIEAVALRAQAFALVSGDERTFGAQVMGVDPIRERRLSSLPDRIVSGRYLATGREAIIGATLAVNLAVGVGDEVVVLGSGKDGGIAAMAIEIVGVFDSGIIDLDRSLLQVELRAFQEAFDLTDEGHVLALRLTDFERTDALKVALQQRLGEGLSVRSWSELMPELEQMVGLKQAGTEIFFVLLALLVTFSVFNTFAMTVFERSREFGMLLAVGMRPGQIMLQLQLEAALMCLLGVALGVGMSVLVVSLMARTGIPLGDVGELLRQYHMPDRLYPSLAHGVLVAAPVLMFVSIQLAAAIPTLRVRHMQPATELRAAA